MLATQKKMALAALIAAIAIGTPTDVAQSWLLRQQKQSHTQYQQPQQESARDHRGTEDEPLSVNVVATTEQKAQTEKKDIEAKELGADNRKLVEYAWDQVFVGIVQFCVFVLQLIAFTAQACYMRRTIIEMQRPKLVIRELLLFPITPSRSSPEVRYVIANKGAGHAEIVESHIELVLIKDASLQPLQPIEGANQVGKVTLEPGQHISRDAGSKIGSAEFLNEMHRQLYDDADDSTKLFFRGFIIYVDKNKLRRRTAFCRGYKFKARRFRIVDDPDYEYAD